MSTFLQFLMSGLTSGSIYALAALGLTIVFNARSVVNFAQGTFFMLGGMTAAALVASGLPLVLAVPAAVAVTVVIGAAVYQFGIRPARSADPINLVIITVGIALLVEGSAAIVFGKGQKLVPPFIDAAPIHFLGATLLPQSLCVMATAAVLVTAVSFYFRRTLTGKAMRAVAINADAASLVGVRPGRFLLVAFCLSAFLGGMAGAVSAPITTTSYDLGLTVGLKGFVGATLGGLGSGLGAVLGGLLVGVCESFAAGYVSTAYKDAVPFIMILGILLFMPQGLLGSRLKDRV